jgi:MFS family permease
MLEEIRNSGNLSSIKNSGTNDSQSVPYIAALIPIILGVFVVYLVIGLALPAIPLHVHNDLGMGSFAVGCVAGAQFAASLVSRIWSGNYSDKKGGRKAMIAGLSIASFSGIFYLLSLLFVSEPVISISILIVGRTILGAAESFIISGALVWSMSIAGKANTGKVMAYVGTAMYVAFAIGAPAGTFLFKFLGFNGIAWSTAIVPLLALIIIIPCPSKTIEAPVKVAVKKVIAAVWLPGLGLAFSSLGFGAVTTFIILLFEKHGWVNGWLALTLFASSFVLIRLLLGHLPDKLGGAKVALVFVTIEIAGLLLIGFANYPTLAFIGATITGVGYSLVFPSLGLEAVKNAPHESKGIATGIYTAFLDLALGIANPLLGLLADAKSINTVFIISGFISLGTIIFIVLIIKGKENK